MIALIGLTAFGLGITTAIGWMVYDIFQNNGILPGLLALSIFGGILLALFGHFVLGQL